MYDSLSNKGRYRETEGDDADKDDGFLEYKQRVSPGLAPRPEVQLAQQLHELAHQVNRRQAASPQPI